MTILATNGVNILWTMNDNKEFINILMQNKRIIYKVCFMYADDNDDINDLYQEVVLSLWKAYQNFEGRSSVSTWIYRIALNTCITGLRKKKNYDYVPLQQDIDILDDCERDELLKQMYHLIHQLDNVDRMYIMLWLDEKNYDEIAEIVGVSRNNVAIRIHRIKEKLKRMSDQ